MRPESSPQSQPAKHSELSCGECTVCCEVLRVDELNKPSGTLCEHCVTSKGCRIYETRFEICRTYRCMWLQGVFGNRPELRPDRSGVLFQYSKCAIPDTHQVQAIAIRDDIGEPAKEMVQRMSETELVTLCFGKQRMVLGPKEKTEALQRRLAELGVEVEHDTMVM